MNLRETGVIVILIGISVFLLGFIMLADKALMICGNILVSIGILILTRSRLFNLLHIDKLQGTVLFILGFMFILYGFVFLGFILEVTGLALLLKESIPSFKTILKGLILGRALKKIK